MKISKLNSVDLKKISSKSLEIKQDSTCQETQDYMVHSAQIPFTAIHKIVPKLVNIDVEKSKLLRQISDILEFDTSELTKEQTAMSAIRQILEAFRAIQLKRETLKTDIERVVNDRTLNKQQQLNILNQYKKEISALKKNPIRPPKSTPNGEERTDFQLMHKFKTAIINGDFNLRKVFKKYYAELGNITTIEELNKKYPKIKVPPRPENVVAKKITDSLTRDFFEEFEKRLHNDGFDKTIELIDAVVLSACNNAKISCDPDIFREKLLIATRKSVHKKYIEIKGKDAMASIPINRKIREPLITENDAKLLSIDFDDFVLSTHKRQYLSDEKLNDIIYEQNGIKIPLRSLSNTPYKMEKVSDKVRKMITDANQMLQAERAYDQFPPEKLKTRLEHFIDGPVGENNEFLDLIIRFDSCRFEPEDITMLKKFLSIMDDIEDETIDIAQGINKTRKNNIRPQGTETLNKLELEEIERKLKLEQHAKAQLKNIQNDFDEMIDNLYLNGLNSAANTCSKYRPKSLDPKDTEHANFIMKLIKEHSSPETGEITNKLRFEESLSRWNTFNHYQTKNPNSPTLKKAINIATKDDGTIDIDKAGQYILNSERVENYPDSLNFVLEPEILKKIMEKAKSKDEAIRYLSKFDDYITMPESEKTKISSVSELFNIKDPLDKILLKHIVENDYISTNTTIQTKVHEKSADTFKSVFAAEAKQQLLEEIPYPECLEYFKGFENAIATTTASDGGTGVKRLGNKNEALAHKMEVKIRSIAARLFSSKNDYVFDIFSKDGLH